MESVEQFAARRRTDQADMEKDLFADVTDAMRRYPAQGWYDDLLREVARLYTDTYHREGGQGTPTKVDDFVKSVRDTLDKTKNPDDNTVDRVSTWLSTAILNAATLEASDSTGEFVVMEWVTMHDDDVRPAHREAEGQQRPPGEPFNVGGATLRYPGDPTAPIELWINCRCTLAPVPGELAAKEVTVTASTEEAIDERVAPVATPWYGVLAPEEVWSGDGRKFNDGALSHADLPLPLTWQKSSDDGHKGSVTVAKIEQAVRVDGQYRASGTFLMSPEADEAIGLVADFGQFGISVDADNAEFEFDEDSEKVAFSSARIRSASMVPIPAFAEAYISLGDAPPGFLGPDAECDPTDPDGECYDPEAVAPATGELSAKTFKDYDTEQRKKAHTVPGTDSYPIEDCEDLRNAIQAIGRAKDPAATKRHIKTQKNRLGCPDVAIPDSWSADAEAFGRGPGWITNPVATKRIHDYWTRKGEEGYAKINWGVPGDFDRCRVQVGEEIGENSPEDLVFLNQICAQWHHDALGWWPGRPTAGEVESFVLRRKDGTPAPAISLVTAGGWCAPSDWFDDPEFTPGDGRMTQDPKSGEWACPLTVTDDGRVFGHVAGWKTCHTAYADMCVAPPHSATDYAYFRTGVVQTTSGPVAVGQITMAGGHAAPGPLRSAVAHYDNTCTAVADVACGEDPYGIWVTGAIRPGTTDDQVYALRASCLSGDWRQYGTGDEMEMIAALAVNTPGFPIPRVGVSNGVQVSLVAAGCVVTSTQPTVDDIVDRVLAEMAARVERKERMAELAARIGV